MICSGDKKLELLKSVTNRLTKKVDHVLVQTYVIFQSGIADWQRNQAWFSTTGGKRCQHKKKTTHTNQICVLAKTFSSRLRLVLQGPLLDDPDLVGAGGIVVYGETALRCWKICCLTTALLISFTTFIFQGGGKFPRGVQNFSWGDHHHHHHHHHHHYQNFIFCGKHTAMGGEVVLKKNSSETLWFEMWNSLQ